MWRPWRYGTATFENFAFLFGFLSIFFQTSGIWLATSVSSAVSSFRAHFIVRILISRTHPILCVLYMYLVRPWTFCTEYFSKIGSPTPPLPSPLRQLCMRCSGSISLELFFRDSSRQFELVEEAVLVLVTQFCLQLQVLGSRQLRNPRGSVAVLAVLQAAITSHAKADSCVDPSLQTRVRECTSNLYEQPVLIPSLL